MKNKDKTQRGCNKGRTHKSHNKKRRFPFFALQEASRIDNYAAHDQKEKERSEENIAWRFGETPEGEKTC